MWLVDAILYCTKVRKINPMSPPPPSWRRWQKAPSTAVEMVALLSGVTSRERNATLIPRFTDSAQRSVGVVAYGTAF